MLSEFIDGIFSKIGEISFDALMWIVWGSFAAVFIATLFLTLCVQRIKAAQKKPFFYLVNAYSALTFAAFVTEQTLPVSVLAAVIFWCAGYLLYGLLCIITKKKKQAVIQSQVAISSLPATPAPAKQQPVMRAEVPAAKSTVRLEHAISVTDRLLQKNLGKSDRQELEQLKNTLALLQMKGALTPAESDILNDNFNALLKL
ncbi:MAG: hypothetical protein K2N22_03580, partial [Clostridia bacterium]|nr:hypothetical protein [Clostridia bacterium]